MGGAPPDGAASLGRRIEALERLAGDGTLPQGRVAPARCRGIAAFSRGEPAEAADLLAGALPELTRIAGSHAQREVFEDTLIAALLGCGRSEAARTLLAERLVRRPRARDTASMAATALKRRD
jgi:hypothetical protein